jgi:hypothetical protein
VAILRCAVHRPSIAFLTIAGVMIAVADATAHEMAGNGSSAVASGLFRSGFGAASSGSLGLDNRRLATAGRPVRRGDARLCPSPSADKVVSLGGPAPQPESQSGHLALAAVRLVSRHRVRVTRMENGSVLLWRELPAAHVIAVPLDANDDTASDGDDTSDDDDSRDDLNGDEDRDPLIIAWLDAMGPHVIVPDCTRRGMSWNVPTSFPPFLTLERLRC